MDTVYFTQAVLLQCYYIGGLIYSKFIMLINLLSTLFFSTKLYLSASLNRYYIPGGRALLIVIVATALDDISYYCFDSKYALDNFSFVFYFCEIIISCFILAIISRLCGGSVRQCAFKSIFKPFSYTLSPVIFGSILLIAISTLTDLNIAYHSQVQIGAFIILTIWLWGCQYLFIMSYFDSLKTIPKLVLFIINISIYLGMHEFKEYFYLFLSESQ